MFYKIRILPNFLQNFEYRWLSSVESTAYLQQISLAIASIGYLE